VNTNHVSFGIDREGDKAIFADGHFGRFTVPLDGTTRFSSTAQSSLAK
jgi:hypothetical protein